MIEKHPGKAQELLKYLRDIPETVYIDIILNTIIER
jgi:hypothetical protein